MNQARSDALSNTIAFFETMSRQSLEQLAQIYDRGVHFVDPFNDVQGINSVLDVFVDMFDTVENPRFEIITAFESVSDTRHDAFLTWNFHFRRVNQPQPMMVHGSSHLSFSPDGRIVRHRDYWDAAGELYEKIPVLGSVLRMVRRKISSKPDK